MCGIFAYTGTKDCRETLVSGLRSLEYRGYDSAGMVCVNEKQEVFLEKAVGRVSALANKVDTRREEKGDFTTGIAHTRWATHGGVTEANTHPHISSNERFYVVHNGIIENYKELKLQLEKKYKFYSETDTEVIAKLVEDLYDGNLKSTLELVSEKLVGAYSLAVLDRKNPGCLVGMKLGSPLIVGQNGEEIYISSDINALSSLAEKYTILEDYEMVVIDHGKFSIYMSGKFIERASQKIEKNEMLHELGTFSSYTEKEIFEIPEIIENVFSGRIDFEKKVLHNETLDALVEQDIQRIVIIASGSSSYAGGVGMYLFKKYAQLETQVIISSEFLADTFLPDFNALYIFLSQSGETADVRESMKIVKAK